MGLTVLKSRCLQSCISSGPSREESLPCPFQLRVSAHIPWLMAVSLWPLIALHHLLWLFCLHLLLYKHPWLTHLVNPGYSPYFKILNHIKSLLPYKATHSKVLLSRWWTSPRIPYSVHHKLLLASHVYWSFKFLLLWNINSLIMYLIISLVLSNYLSHYLMCINKRYTTI